MWVTGRIVCAPHGETVTCAPTGTKQWYRYRYRSRYRSGAGRGLGHGGSVRRYTHVGFICTQARSSSRLLKSHLHFLVSPRARRRVASSPVPSAVPCSVRLRSPSRRARVQLSCAVVLTRLALSRHHTDGHNSELTARGAGRDGIASSVSPLASAVKEDTHKRFSFCFIVCFRGSIQMHPLSEALRPLALLLARSIFQERLTRWPYEFLQSASKAVFLQAPRVECPVVAARRSTL